MYAQFSRFRYLRSALQLWKVRRVQAILSSLGIVVGVSGLVLVIALGEGASMELETALGTLGSGSVIVKRQHEAGAGTNEPATTSHLLGHDRVAATRRLLADYLEDSTVLKLLQSNAVSSESRLDAAKVIGTDRHYQSIYKLQLHAGRFLAELDTRQKQRVCVLGWDAARSLFPRGQVIGQQLRLGKNWYLVVGWLKPVSYQLPKLEALQLAEMDRVIYVSATTLSGNTTDLNYDQLVYKFRTEQQMTSALESLKHILTFGGQSTGLDYIVPIELLRQKQKLQQIFQYVLMGIAALMLIVGGVGIMNMMMVNVISRKPEIGLRRAIGATRKDIITQFVTESSVIALVGGFSGILIGLVFSVLIDLLTTLPMAFSGVAAAIGFCSSVAIGIIFGSYPALQAASVSPVQALNEL